MWQWMQILVLEVICGRHSLDMQAMEIEEIMMLHTIWWVHWSGSLLNMTDAKLLQALQLLGSIPLLQLPIFTIWLIETYISWWLWTLSLTLKGPSDRKTYARSQIVTHKVNLGQMFKNFWHELWTCAPFVDR